MKYIFLILGSLLSLAAVFANQLGIDNDAGWGGGRALLLKVGLVLIFLGLILHVFQHPIREFQTRVSNLVNIIGREHSIHILFFAVTVLTAVAYIWFIRLDERNTDRTYNYFSELAKGFRQGNLYLPETPSTALLILSNPYDPALRKQEGIEDFPWDITLYEDRFYIYWGPTPALLLLPFSNDMLSRIEDYHLTIVFAFGLFLYAGLIVTSFWQYNYSAPVWVMVVLLLVIGFSIPVTTMLKRAEVYEAAIFACQFFFIGGCYWAFSSLMNEKPVAWKFALAGIHWSFAIAARITILPAVAVTTLVMIFPVLAGFRDDLKSRIKLLLAAGLPLLIGGIALVWYNYVRFGSFFEFGVRYQLANVDYTRFEGSFGLRYLAENLKTYLLHPIVFASRYPFISLVEYTPSNDRLSGLLYIAPCFVLAFLPLTHLFFRNKKTSITKAFNNRVLALFAGAAVVPAFIISIFYFITLRYTLDFMPSTLILIALSLGLEYESLKGKRFGFGVLSLIFGALAFVNIIAGILLATPESGVAFMLNFLNALSKLFGLR